jgi:hypothetical protein
MAVTPLRSGTLAYAASDTITPTIPTHATDDLLVAVFGNREDDPVPSITTPPSGWTQVGTVHAYDAGQLGIAICVFWKKAASASETDPTLVWNTGAARGTYGIVHVFSGQDLTSPMDAVAAVGSAIADTTSFTPGAVETQTDGALVVSIATQDDDTTLALDTPQSFNLDAQANTASGSDYTTGLATKTQATAGTVTMPTWGGGNDAWAYESFALKPGSGDQAVTTEPITSGSTLYVPEADYQVVGPTIATGLNLYAAELAYAVVTPTIAAGSALYVPTVAAGPVTVVGEAIATGSVLYAPEAAYEVVGPTIAAGSITFAPGPLDLNVDAAHITSGVALYASSLSYDQPVTGVAISSGLALYLPSVSAAAPAGPEGPEWIVPGYGQFDDRFGDDDLADGYPEDNRSAAIVLHSALYLKAGQETEPGAGILTRSHFWMLKFGSPTGDVVSTLYASDGGSPPKPTGAALATSTAVDAASLSTSYAWVEFTFTDAYEMAAAIDYFIAVEYSGGDGTNYIAMGTDNSSPTHPGSAARYVASWAALSPHDCVFHIFRQKTAVTAAEWIIPGWGQIQEVGGVEVTGEVTGAHIASGIALYVPTVIPDQAVTTEAIAAGSTLYAPEVFYEVVGGTIASGSALYAPSQLDFTITGGTIASGNVLYPATAKGSNEVGGGTIAAGSALYAATIDAVYSITSSFLASAAALFVATITTVVSGGTIASASALYPPTVGLEVTGEFIASGSSVAAPTVAYAADTAFLSSGLALYVPTVDVGAVGVVGNTIAAGSSLSVPTLAYAVVGPTISGETLVDSYSESNQDGLQNMWSGSTERTAQRTQPGAGVLVKARWYLRKTGSPPESVIAKLYASDAGSPPKPTGSPLATSETIAASSLGTSFALFDFDFTDEYAMADATWYFISVEYPYGSGANRITVGKDISSPTHNGSIATYTSSVWVGDAGVDACFYLYHGGGGATLYAPTLAHTVNAAFIASGLTLYEPTVELEAGPQAVTGQFIASGVALYTITRVDQNVPVGPTIAAGSTLYAPEVAYAVDAATIATGSAVYQPTPIEPTYSVTGGTIASGSALYAPSATYEVQGATIASGLVLYEATVAAGAVAVTAEHVASTATLYAATVSPGAVTVVGESVASTAALYAATLAYVVEAATIPSGIATYAPTLAYEVTSAFIASGAVLYPASVQGYILGAHIPSGAALYVPTVVPEQFITGEHVASGATLYAPTLAYQVEAQHIASSAALYAATAEPGAVSVTGATIASGLAPYPPTVAAGAVTVTGQTIGAASALYAPELAHEVLTAAIASGSVLYPATLDPVYSVTAAFISSGSVLYPPNVQGFILGAHIASTVAFYLPTVVPEQPVTTGTVASGLAVYAPSVQATYEVTGQHIASSLTAYAPSVAAGAVSVTGEHVATTAILYPPALAAIYSVTGATIAAGSVLYAPDLSQVAEGAHIGSTAALYAATVTATQEITGAHIASSATLFEPSLAQAVAAAHVASGLVLYAPTVTLASLEITAGTIAIGSQLYAVTVVSGAEVTTAFIPSGATLYPPIVAHHVVASSPRLMIPPAQIRRPRVKAEDRFAIVPRRIRHEKVKA